ncbi:MOSC domain-containing protein [Nitrincola sp. MINF-07-Sa-05]|uniref:MOSC domain-containing protein n=1 Tax=Nitrincola salilacus TaxID=3400273 RepID=UPI0039183EFF
MFEVVALTIYPVKSLQGISLNDAQLGVRGLAHDRNWMIVDDEGHFVTQRQIPKMATIRVALSDQSLVLSNPDADDLKGFDDLKVPLQLEASVQRDVVVWGDQCKALDAGDEASTWLTTVLGEFKGQKLHLVRFADDTRRNVDPNYLQDEEAHTAFSDGFPFLITTEASLDALNQQLRERGASPVGMERFRPSIVLRDIDGAGQPFAEDGWKQVREQSGAYELGIRKPCQRCKITTVDQQTGQISEPAEPLRTLAAMNTQPTLKGAFFGQNAILSSGEGVRIAVGDRLLAE